MHKFTEYTNLFSFYYTKEVILAPCIYKNVVNPLVHRYTMKSMKLPTPNATKNFQKVLTNKTRPKRVAPMHRTPIANTPNASMSGLNK